MTDTDVDNNLELFCYVHCGPEDDDIIRQCRGVVFNGDQIVMHAFPYTVEFNDTNIELITKNKREYLLTEIASAFVNLLKKQKGIVPVSVTSAVKLEKQTLAQILDKLKTHVEGDFEVTEEVDPFLIGGFVVKMDDKQIDASIATQLNRMKIELAN